MRSLSLPMMLALPAALGVAWAGWRIESRCDGDEPASQAQTETVKRAGGPAVSPRTWTTAVDPKPLSSQVKKGLDWLVHNQLPSGGWGQGEESPTMRANGDALRDKPNVADTCIAALALIRSGSTPHEGPYKDAIARAVQFVTEQVEASDASSIAVTSVQGTRVQQKLGPNIDTFLASMLLSEVKGRMADVEQASRTDRALTKVLDKIHRHQKADGTFDGQGWAPVLAQALCGKGINRAQQAGAQVNATALTRAENSAKLAFATTPTAGKPGAGSSSPLGGRSVTFSSDLSGMSRGSAGVELYDRSASLGVLQDSVNTNKEKIKGLRDKAQNGRDGKEREEAKAELTRIDDLEKVNREAQQAVVERLKDPQFISGFGSNGGEEFLSYMNIGESLVVKGGDEWKKWDSSMTANLNRIQNDDGSWTGHHCITGRTFCTSSALLVLMADRTPIPVQSQDNGKSSSPPAAPASTR